MYRQLRDSARWRVTFAATPVGRSILTFYVIAGLPLAFLDGDLLESCWIYVLPGPA